MKDIAIDIVLTDSRSYPTPTPYANYSANYHSGVLLKGGREHIMFHQAGDQRIVLHGNNKIPEDTPESTKYLAAVIDAGDQFQESNEENNVAYCRLKIQKTQNLNEDCVRFNPATTEVTQIDKRWKVVDGQHWLFDFVDKQTEAEKALQVIKYYQLNQSCFVGRPDPHFKYLLTGNSPPAGEMSGEDCIEFNPNQVTVKQVDNRWKIVENGHWLFDFADKQAEARKALKIIKYYRFNHSCFVGRPNPHFQYLRQ